ncbi:tetratricopeptide repeat protein [Nocardioides cavernaquae]|uniref:Tetratricopeptide repeat protein n=1 Tax=Nocardioides cavernaquae TaxID=2321396 RepID=A0A3A5H9L4_9ACTN|nr:tetratricopeptide repeat protein [Nocardioides cavernaquae]RJS47306.1 tetratricopeptide repeat protein [Nocardioides cavernaquae]
MAEQSRPRRSESPRGGRPEGRSGGPAARGGKPESRVGKPDSRGGKPDPRGATPEGRGGKPGERGGKSEFRTGGKFESRDSKPGSRDGKPAGRGGKPDSRGGKPGGDRPGRKDDWKRPREDSMPRSEQQARYDGPEIPEEITGKELDRSVIAQLRTLPEKLGLRVARHLAAAGMIIDEDPKTAYEHTLAARARAARLAVVREACGEAAYAAGEYAEALSELRAAKRMNGATSYLPIMADCERALGRPERALTLAKSPSVANFEPEAKAEMTIVEAGARRDMGEIDAALRTLEFAPLTSRSRASWVVRLRYAYADTLEAAGRLEEALTWFHRTEGVDGDEITDAGARAAALEKKIG